MCKRSRKNLPDHAKNFLLQEFNRMRQHPYPTPKERLRMAQKIGISVEKVNNWFINQRRRFWSPSKHVSQLNTTTTAAKSSTSLPVAQHLQKSGTQVNTIKRGKSEKQLLYKEPSEAFLLGKVASTTSNTHQIAHCKEPDLSFTEGTDEDVMNEPFIESNNRLGREEAADILGRMAEYEVNFQLENLFHSETIVLPLKKRKTFDRSHSLKQIEFRHNTKCVHNIDKACNDQMPMLTNDKNGWIMDLLLQRNQKRQEEPIALNNCESRVQQNLFLTIQPKKYEFKLLFKQNTGY